MEGWKEGRMDGWNDGRMEGWMVHFDVNVILEYDE